MTVTENEWREYNEIVGIYDAIMAPHFSLRPARDLIRMLGLSRGGKVLDIGTGPGTAALLAGKEIGPEGLLVGMDVSLGMLRRAESNGVSRVVAGTAPGLPFPDGGFHGVVANFVISHIPEYGAALVDMTRVLRSEGRLGISAWGARENEVEEAWGSVAELFVKKELLEEALQLALPAEAWFSNADNLQQILRDVGLAKTTVKSKEYKIKMALSHFLEYKSHSLSGRFIQYSLESNLWGEFKRRVANELQRLTGNSVELSKQTHLAVGTKP